MGRTGSIILGSVQHPGVLYFDDTPTLLDVIARGGLLANPAPPPPPERAVRPARYAMEFRSAVLFIEATTR